MVDEKDKVITNEQEKTIINEKFNYDTPKEKEERHYNIPKELYESDNPGVDPSKPTPLPPGVK